MASSDDEGSELDPQEAPTQDEGGSEGKWVGRIGNFSVQYNMGVASIAVHIMGSYDDHIVGGRDPASPYVNMTGEYPEPAWAKYIMLGMIFLGAVAGMLAMGTLGDVIGRKQAMRVTLSLVVFGAVGCGLLSWGGVDGVYGVISVCRLFVGIGVGGIYPLSAARSAEHGGDAAKAPTAEERTETALKVGWAFFWQVPGMMAPYVAALVLLLLHRSVPMISVTVQWRLLFLLGAVPALAVIYLNHRTPESQVFLASQEQRGDAERTFSPWGWARAHPQWPALSRGLGGMSACWFLYDVALYGTAIFTPTILKSIFGEKETLTEMAFKALLTTAVGIPACIGGIHVLRRKGSYYLQFGGFLFMGAAYAMMALGYILAPVDPVTGERGWANFLFLLYLVICMSILTGPIISTFVLPATLFPTEVKTSFHGFASASGKVGAVVGTFMFHPLSEATSVQFVMIVQSFLSVLGAVVTYWYIPRTNAVIGSESAHQLLDDNGGKVEVVGAGGTAQTAPPPRLTQPGAHDDVYDEL